MPDELRARILHELEEMRLATEEARDAGLRMIALVESGQVAAPTPEQLSIYRDQLSATQRQHRAQESLLALVTGQTPPT